MNAYRLAPLRGLRGRRSRCGEERRATDAAPDHLAAWASPRSWQPRPLQISGRRGPRLRSPANSSAKSAGFPPCVRLQLPAAETRRRAATDGSNAARTQMQLVIERGELLRALGHVTSVVERRTTIPILSNVLLKASDRACNSRRPTSNARLSSEAPADVSQPGAVTVPAHVLHDIVRKLPDGAQVEIEARRRKRAADAARATPASRCRRWRPRTFPIWPPASSPTSSRLPPRPEAPDRQDPLRHLHRGDALLPQRHLSAHRPLAARRRRCARSQPTVTGWPRLSCRCPRRRGHARHHPPAQDRARAAPPDRR